jgi:hypothetical protein
MPEAVYRHSGIPASMHVHCQIHAAWPKPCCVSMSMSTLHVRVHATCPCQYPCTYIEMPECWTFWHPVSPVPDWKKLTMPEQVRYGTKLAQSGIFLVQYRTKIRHAGMPMPALVSTMPMPSYAMYFPAPSEIHTLCVHRPVSVHMKVIRGSSSKTKLFNYIYLFKPMSNSCNSHTKK